MKTFRITTDVGRNVRIKAASFVLRDSGVIFYKSAAPGWEMIAYFRNPISVEEIDDNEA